MNQKNRLLCEAYKLLDKIGKSSDEWEEVYTLRDRIASNMSPYGHLRCDS